MPQRAFAPIYPNPYIAGNPIRSREMFFGRLDEFRFIARTLEDGRKTALIVLFGERRSGKSSILYQILNGRLGENFLPIFVDMQIMAGIGSDVEFFNRIIADCSKQVASNDSERYLSRLQEPTATNTFRHFLQELKGGFPERALLLLIDEYEILEAKINEGSLSPHLLTFFAGLLETDLVSFVFTGSKSLEAHDRTLWGDDLFRKASSRKISFLTKDDTARLITQPLQGRVTFAPEVVAQIYTLTAGQPFYTQIICQNLVYHLNEVQKYEVTRRDLAVVVDGILENPPPQLLFNWGEHSSQRKLALSLLAEFSETPETFFSAGELCKEIVRHKLELDVDANFLNTELASLFQDEQVVQKGRKYGFRLDLYRQWVRHDHNIWQVKKEIGARELARITKQAHVKKKKKQRALKILERVGEAALVVAVISLVVSVIFAKKRSVIVQANGGPFEVWVDNKKYGTTKGLADSTRFEIPDGFTKIKNYIFAFGAKQDQDDKFRSGLTINQEYEFTLKLQDAGEKVTQSYVITQDKQELNFEFKPYSVQVITNAAIAEIQLGGDSAQIKQNNTDAWQHEFKACAGTYVLRAKDRRTGQVKLDTVVVPTDSLVKVNFDGVVVVTFVAKDSFSCTWHDSQPKKRSIPTTRPDSFLIILRGVSKGSHRFAFKNLRTKQDSTVQIFVQADTTIPLKFDPNYGKQRGKMHPTPVTFTEASKTAIIPKQHRLSFVSDPPGASVYFKGVHWNNTPFDTTLEAGEYSFTFKKAGYDSVTKQIYLTRDETLFVKLSAQYGILKLMVYDDEEKRSLPDVEVRINGDYKGKTIGPVMLIDSLLAIKYELELNRFLYEIHKISFEIKKGEITSIPIYMKRRR